MKQYTIEYYENGTYEDIKEEVVLACTKADAYDCFMKKHPAVYSAWVARFTTQRGDVHVFNTFSGMPY